MNDAKNRFPNGAMRKILHKLKRHEASMVKMLGMFVRSESPSHDKKAVDRFGTLVAAEWRKRGAKLKVLATAKRQSPTRRDLVGSGT